MSTGNEHFDPYAQWLGLNLGVQSLDHYSLLGLARFENDPVRIEHQADERMRLVRSFQTGPRGKYTPKLLNELAAAKRCLLSPELKLAYDQQLQNQLPMQVGGWASPGSAASLAYPLPPPILPPEQAPPLPAEVSPPPVGHQASAAEDHAADNAEEESGESSPAVSMPMLAVGLVLGTIGVGIVVWMMSWYAMEQGWIAGGPARGGPPPPLVSKNSSKSTTGASDNRDEAESNGSRLETSVDDSSIDSGQPVEVLQEGSGDVVLSPATAVTAGDVQLELDGTEEVLSLGANLDDSVTWRFRLIRPGFFELQIMYAGKEGAFGRKLQFEIDGQRKTLEMQPSASGFRTDLLTIAVPKSGPHELTLTPGSVVDDLVRVKLIRLKAVGAAKP